MLNLAHCNMCCTRLWLLHETTGHTHCYTCCTTPECGCCTRPLAMHTATHAAPHQSGAAAQGHRPCTLLHMLQHTRMGLLHETSGHAYSKHPTLMCVWQGVQGWRAAANSCAWCKLPRAQPLLGPRPCEPAVGAHQGLHPPRLQAAGMSIFGWLLASLFFLSFQGQAPGYKGPQLQA